MFNVRDAGNYEKLMGRWSRRLAPLDGAQYLLVLTLAGAA
jgi:hypothetical protein